MNRIRAALFCLGMGLLAGCTIPFSLFSSGPQPLAGTPDLGALAFETPTLLGTPSPLPTETPTATNTPDSQWTPYWLPSPTYSPYSWSCVDDGSPDPCHRVFRGISMLSSDEGWIVGERGVILHRHNGEWTRVSNPLDISLRIVRSIAAGDAWAIGDQKIVIGPAQTRVRNVFLRWNGRGWSEFVNPTPFGRVVDLSFVSPTDGWGIAADDESGTGTVLIHWDGKSWQGAARPPELNAISMLSRNDGWAVGNGGAILHWDGKIWSQAESPTDKDLDGIGFVSPDEGWATSSQGVILRWIQNTWMVYSSLAPDPRRMIVNAEGNGWMFGSWIRGDVVLNWSGKEWTPYKGASPDGEVLGLSAPDVGEWWAIGWVPGKSRTGMIWSWGNQGWSRALTGSPEPVRAAAFLADDSAWAVGEDGVIAHWNGAGWTEVKSGTPQTLNAIAFPSTDEGWAAGEGSQILHWDGEQWAEWRAYQWRGSVYRRLDALAFPAADDGWAAGAVEGGDLLRPWMLHWDGKDWLEAPLYEGNDPPCKCTLSALGYSAPDDLWAVGGGEKALMMHWDGETWTSYFGPEGYRLFSVTALAPNDAWVFGVQEIAQTLPLKSLALHWDGKAWKYVSLPADVTSPAAAAFSKPDDGWAAGQGILHWNGSGWGAAFSPVDAVIVALARTDSGTLWAVTDTGTVLKLEVEK